MAQRKKDVRDACKFEFTDEEIKVLRDICHMAAENPNHYQVAKRFEVFFANALAMKPREFVFQEIL